MTSLAGEDLLDSSCGEPPFMLWESNRNLDRE
jgi:hypothetical protein